MQEVIKNIQYCVDFTYKYKELLNANKSIREGELLKIQVPYILQTPEKDELIVGFMKHNYVGFSPQYGGLYTYYFHEEEFYNDFQKNRANMPKEYDKHIMQVIEFWKTNQTVIKYENALSKYKCDSLIGGSYAEPGLANCGARIAGTVPNLKKLVELGLGGLEAEIKEKPQTDFYQGLILSIEAIRNGIDFYIDEVIENNLEDKENIIRVLKNIKHKRPETFREGLQLIWLYAVSSDLMNYGFLDEYLGDLYANDIEKNVITEEEAIKLLASVWKQMLKIWKVHDARVIIGGSSYKTSKNANMLAKVILKTSKKVKEVVPQLTLMVHEDTDPELLEEAFEVLSTGTTFPILYNEKAINSGLDGTFGQEYIGRVIPFGCGEFVVEGKSIGTPNNGVNLLKALELALHSGFDPYHKVQCGLKTKTLAEINSFEQLWEEYQKLLIPAVRHLAIAKDINYKIAAKDASYLHLSLLMDNCIEKGLPMLDGGVHIRGASSEIFGIMSCADSFKVINELVFENKKYTLSELVGALDANFENYHEIYNDIKNIVKYGNDDEKADAMAIRVFDNIAELTEQAGKELTNLDIYKIVSVNNSMSAEWGEYCIASACGRKKSSAMSNANAPSIGADQQGVTSLLKSMSKFNHNKHVGVINNVRFTKELFDNNRPKIIELFEVFFENGGFQSNITVLNHNDLLRAMDEPEKYKDLIVRLGGFSARFVELSPIVQKEIINRTTY